MDAVEINISSEPSRPNVQRVKNRIYFWFVSCILYLYSLMKGKDPKPKKSNQHFAHLSGLMGLCAYSIIWCHGGYFYTYQGYHVFGHVAVVFFFVKSALLLTYQGLDRYEESSSKISFWMQFFVRRFFRVYPVYVVWLFLGIVVRPGSLGLSGFVHYALLQGLNNVYWCISTEIESYFLIPIVVHVYHVAEKKDGGSWTRRISAIVLLVVTGLLFHFYWEPSWPYGYPYPHLGPYTPIFLCGSLAGIIARIMKKHSFRVSASITSLVCIVVFILLALRTAHFSTRIFGEGTAWNLKAPISLPTGVLVSIFLTLFIFHSKDSLIQRFFEWNFFTWMGSFSYEMYITHIAMTLFVWRDHRIGDIDGQLCVLALTFFVSWIMNKLVGLPGVAIGSRICKFIETKFAERKEKYFLV